MEDNSLFMFLIRYLICTGLLIFTYKFRKKNDLLKSIIISFAALSILLIINYLLSTGNFFKNERPFYEVNFLDFLIVTLCINAFSKQAQNKKV